MTTDAPSARTPRLPRSRGRNAELGLLLLALVTVATAGYAASTAINGDLANGIVGEFVFLCVIAAVAHLAVRFLAPYADPVVVPVVILLNGIGLVMIYRLDEAYRIKAQQNDTSFSPDGPAQLTWTGVGLVAFVAVLLLIRNHRVLERFTYTTGAVGLILVALPALLPAEFSEVNGADIWIRFGGLSFQPAEVAKILLIISFAGYLVAKRDVLALAGRRVLGVQLPRGRDAGPVFLAWVISLGILAFEKDLGSALLFFGIFLAMLYLATGRLSWVVVGAVLFLAGATVGYFVSDKIALRVDIWLDPWHDAQGSGYQLVQSLIAIATGRVVGTGLGLGHPDIVPYANTDFIGSSIAEEMGLVTMAAVIVCFGLLLSRGFKAAVLLPRDPFGALLAAGLATSIAMQVFVIIGGISRLIPLTGLTTPFLSYGGSSLLANWALVGLLLRVTNDARRPKPPAPDDDAVDAAATQAIAVPVLPAGPTAARGEASP